MDFEPIHIGHTITDTMIRNLFRRFRDLTLPAEHWTHEAHIIGALCLIRDCGLTKAEARMPDMIRTFNIAKGGVNSDTEGYHHTLTIFYLRLLNQYYEANKDKPFPQLCETAVNAPIGGRKYPLQYYSKGLLFSLKARKYWVEPDLKSL